MTLEYCKLSDLSVLGSLAFQYFYHSYKRGYAVAHLVEAARYKAIPDGVTGIFHWHNPSGRTMALRSTQSLTEMSTRNISWGVKAAGALGWQRYHFHVPIVLKSGSLNLLEHSGSVQGCNLIALPLLLLYLINRSGMFWHVSVYSPYLCGISVRKLVAFTVCHKWYIAKCVLRMVCWL